MSSRRIILYLLAAASLAVAGAPASPKWKRPVPQSASRTRQAQPAVSTADTVAPDSGAVAVSGFEKTLHSSRESMFVTNRTGCSLSGLCVDITYKDMDGRMLHRATHWVDAEIPAGETRMVSVPAFDRQNLFYYHLSPLPPRARRATPFKVWVEVSQVVIPHNTQQ